MVERCSLIVTASQSDDNRSIDSELSNNVLKPLPLIFGTVFSSDRQYRYVLERSWGRKSNAIAFIGLNPSTADETTDDATIRRCRGFARDWGYERMFMLNLFGFIATDPANMKRAVDPIGSENDEWLRMVTGRSDLIIAAWGNHGRFKERDKSVLSVIGQGIYCLGKSKSGNPFHPLRLRRDTARELF